MAPMRSRPRGVLERQVLACLAAVGEPLSVAEVRDRLAGELAYTTVLTTLVRLHDKGAVSRRFVGRAHVYSIAGDPASVDASLTARRMRRLLNGDQDRAVVLARFVAELSAEEGRLLADLLADLDARGRRDPDERG